MMEVNMTLYINPLHRSNRRRMMEEMLRDWDEGYTAELTFPIDVRADSESFTITALLPGVDPEDLDIQIVNEIVTISGELKSDRDENAQYLLAERPSGRFHRVITLPTPLDAANVQADLENGILSVTIPKAEEAKPRTIKVVRK
jgi:HSP20 family protein